MVYAEKGNRVKQINESEIQRYVEQGYQITNGRGTVLKETVPTDLPTLRLAFTKHIEEIGTLKQQIAQLKAEITRLKAENSTLAEASKEVPAPKSTKKQSKVADKVSE